MMKEYRNHPRREVLLSPRYAKHVAAMTVEDLHSKAEIAEELAWRDMKIAKLREQRGWLVDALKYHQEQTQPIQKTRAILAETEGEKMACDICGANDKTLVDLRDEYKAKDIKQICPECETVVNAHLRKSREVTGNERTEEVPE